MKKNVLITGATGALGKAVLKIFLKNDFTILATTSPGKSSELSGPGIHTAEADLTDEAKTTAAVSQLLNENSAIDAAVLLVGGYASGGVAETDGTLLRKMFAMNFETAWFVVKPIFQQMLKQPTGGRIVLVGARPALRAKDAGKSVAYSLSKSLLFRLAEILNEEGGAKNVITSIIVPSTIDTPANRKSMPDAKFENWVKPEEIAEIIAFASDPKNVLREPVLKVYGKA